MVDVYTLPGGAEQNGTYMLCVDQAVGQFLLETISLSHCSDGWSCSTPEHSVNVTTLHSSDRGLSFNKLSQLLDRCKACVFFDFFRCHPVL